MRDIDASVDAWASALTDRETAAEDGEGRVTDVTVRRRTDDAGEPSVELRISEPDGERSVRLSPEESRALAKRLADAAARTSADADAGAVGAED